MNHATKIFRVALSVFTSLVLMACATGTSPSAVGMSKAGPSSSSADVTYASGGHQFHGRLCRPPGKGPFPAVVYNHGGTEEDIGGAPDETCAALARAGYVGFSPHRSSMHSFFVQAKDVEAALDYVAALPYVDASRLGLIGFSSGGALTYMVAAHRGSLKAVVIMAPAGVVNRMRIDPSRITAPVLVLVAKNDTGSKLTLGNDTLASCEMLVARLKGAGCSVTYIVYPPYGRDGHKMFFEVGAYWSDVVHFLRQHL